MKNELVIYLWRSQMISSKKTCGVFEIFCYLFRFIPWHASGILILMLLEALIPAVQTLAVAGFVDQVTAYMQGEAATVDIINGIVLILFCQFCVILFPAVSRMLEETGKSRMDLKLRPELVHKRASLEYRYVEDSESWDLTERVMEEPAAQFMKLFFVSMNLVSLVVTVCSVLLIIMGTVPAAGAAVVAVSIPFCWLSMRSGKTNYDLSREEQRIQRRYRYLGDILLGKETVEERNLFSYSDVIGKEYDRLCSLAYQMEKKIQRKSFVNLKSGSVISLILAVLIIAVLLPPFYRGSLSFGLLTGLVTAIWDLVQSMSWRLSEAMFELARSREFCRDFTAFMEMSEKEGVCCPPASRSGNYVDCIEFRNVSFQYPGTEKYILRNCSFRLEHGKNYAFVGENGAGKTTVIKLLLGLYEEYEGEILLNGKEIRQYSYEEWKSLFAVVSQDFARYELTVRENVMLGDLNTEDERKARMALEKSGLWETVSRLPEGLDTQLGRLKGQGTDFSGGQWQRLAIARLLYADAQVNILDEPTAALDPLQESAIYSLFHEIKGDALTLYVTHRLGAARIADEIFVLKDGRIQESGSHDELMRLENGHYREMYETQRKWYE